MSYSSRVNLGLFALYIMPADLASKCHIRRPTCSDLLPRPTPDINSALGTVLRALQLPSHDIPILCYFLIGGLLCCSAFLFSCMHKLNWVRSISYHIIPRPNLTRYWMATQLITTAHIADSRHSCSRGNRCIPLPGMSWKILWPAPAASAGAPHLNHDTIC